MICDVWVTATLNPIADCSALVTNTVAMVTLMATFYSRHVMTFAALNCSGVTEMVKVNVCNNVSKVICKEHLVHR